MEACRAKKDAKHAKRVAKAEAAEDRAEMKAEIKTKKAEKAPIKVIHNNFPFSFSTLFLGRTKPLQSRMQADSKPDHQIELPVLVEIFFQVKRGASLP